MTFTHLGINLFKSQLMEMWSDSANVENERGRGYKPPEVMSA